MIEYENLNKLNKSFNGEYLDSFKLLLEKGWFVLGENVKAFEKNFADYLGANHCTGVANGLDALFLALKACDFDSETEIIVPSNTYIATILAVINAGLKPVLVEPDIKTYNIDPSLIEEKVTEKTKAVLVVHLYGKSCEMDPIIEICKKKNLKLIEDCAQSHGASYKGVKTGTFGDFGCFSFYPTKNLGCLGDGGAVVCKSEKMNEKIGQMRNYGSKIKYHNEIIGYNSRLDEIQAGFLNIKLRALDKINDHKRFLAGIYFNNLNSDIIIPDRNKNHGDVFHIFNIRHQERDKLKDYLLDIGIKTDIHYPIAPHRQTATREILAGEYPVSDEIHKTTLSLPISYFHTEEDVLKVCKAINSY